MSRSSFDTLASALFDGPVKAIDVQVVPGTNPEATREELADAMLRSMRRVGLIVNDRLVAPGDVRQA